LSVSLDGPFLVSPSGLNLVLYVVTHIEYTPQAYNPEHAKPYT
jgi:hypothetical protein